MKPIGIFCHWHTGSRLLLKVLNACGMELGNVDTGYIYPVGEVRENGVLCTITNEMFLAREAGGPQAIPDYNPEQHKVNFRKTLRTFKEKANTEGWEFFGFKNVQIIHPLVWEHLGDIFKEEWGDAELIVSIRHPLDVVKSTSNDPTWPIERILDYYIATVPVYKYFVNKLKAEVVEFPDFYLDGRIKQSVESLGLTWNKSADIFSKDVVNNVSTTKEKNTFNTKYPEAYKAFLELQGMIPKEEVIKEIVKKPKAKKTTKKVAKKKTTRKKAIK